MACIENRLLSHNQNSLIGPQLRTVAEEKGAVVGFTIPK